MFKRRQPAQQITQENDLPTDATAILGGAKVEQVKMLPIKRLAFETGTRSLRSLLCCVTRIMTTINTTVLVAKPNLPHYSGALLKIAPPMVQPGCRNGGRGSLDCAEHSGGEIPPSPPQNTPFSWVYPDGVLTPRGVRRLPGRVFTWSWTPTGPFPLLVGNLLPKAPSGTHKNKAYNRHKMGSKNTSH